MNKKYANLLIQEPPLQVLPSLAEEIGLERALILQQLYYLLLDKNNGREVKGRKWIYNTYEEWQKTYFRFWSAITIKRYFIDMERKGYIVSCQPEGKMNRRKYYRLTDKWTPQIGSIKQ